MPSPRKWYEIRAAATGGNQNETELLIYGDIGDSWDEESVTAAQLVRDLQAVESEYLTVRINSYGGSVSDGLAIYNAIKRHPAATTVSIDGVAVSIASLIAMAGDTVEIADNALMMIHAPWSVVLGNATEMRKSADMLDKFAQAMSSAYETKSGQSHDTVMAWLTSGEDHWLTAAEASELGLADVITAARQEAAALLDGTRFGRPSAHRKQEYIMPKPNTPENPSTPSLDPENVVSIETAAREKRDSEIVARNQSLRAAFKPFLAQAGVQDLLTDMLSNATITEAEASTRLMTHLGKQAEPLHPNEDSPSISAGKDVRERAAAGIESAIMVRAGLAADSDTGSEFRAMSLTEMASAFLRAHGQDVNGLPKAKLVNAAFTHTDADFPALLANIAEKTLLKGWEQADETYDKWTVPGSLTNFQPSKRVDLNTFGALPEVPPGAEYTYGTIGDRGETIQLASYGQLFSITRHAIINDDLNAFTRIPMRMGRAAKRTIGNLVYAVLTGNPTMSDGVTLFHANHGNLLTASAINTPNTDAMRVAMAKQKDNGNTLNIKLGYLLVPVGLGGTARQVANSEFEVGASTKNNTVPNYMRGLFETIEDARLDDNSATAWYGVANPALFDTVEVAYLDGQQSPYLERQRGFEVDGSSWKVRIDAGVKALDYRTIAKNPGV